jgi:aerobic C4-dicarboxylate transport protein
VAYAVTPHPQPRRGGLLGTLWFQVLLAMLAGLVLGLVWPEAGVAVKPFGDGFIALVRMLIAPIVFCTVVHGIAAMRDMRSAGRVALKAIIYFEIVTTLALVIALLAVNLLQPGTGMHIDPATLDPQAVAGYAAQAKTLAQGEAHGIVAFLLDIIPVTFVQAFVGPNVLPVLFVSVLCGCGLALLGPAGVPLTTLIESLSQVMFRIVALVMWAAPLGAFGAIAFTVGRYGAASLLPLARLIVEFYAVCLFFVFVVLGAVARWAEVSLWRLLVYLREEILIVAATTSTESVLPRLIQKMQGLGCHESVVGLVVPTGYSFNLDGTCLYLAMVAVFLAQATDTPLDVGQQITLLLVLLLVSKGAAGVAGAALVVLAATLAAVPAVPMASIALVVGIHRLLAEALTFVNLIGNSVATIVVSRWEGQLDRELLRSQVGLR